MAPSIFHRMWPARNRILLLVFLLARGLLTAGAEPSPELDLRAARLTEPALKFIGGTGSAGGVGGPGTKTVQFLSVAIVDYRPSNCDKVEQYANVKLLNIGSEPLTLPWSPDGARVVAAEGNTKDQISFDSLSVILRGEGNAAVSMAYTLFGTLAVPSSQITLLPGHSALIRNIALQLPKDSPCSAKVIADFAFSSHRALRSKEGYTLISKETWRVQSQ